MSNETLLTREQADLIARDPVEVELCRARVQVRRLMDMLHANAVGRAWLSTSQLKSIDMLLKLALPVDRAADKAKGEVKQSLAESVVVVPAVAASSDAWQEQYGHAGENALEVDALAKKGQEIPVSEIFDAPPGLPAAPPDGCPEP